MINSKSLDSYYAALASYRAQGVTNELGLRAAFANLLETVAKSQGWTLIQEQKLANRARPDGTLYDAFKIPRGYWEAKDGNDDLDVEIRKKINRGYPLTNSIFEDTRRGVLYQHGRVVFAADLTKKGELADLLHRFLDYSAAQVETFHRAVRQFQDQIPELARGLEQLIEDERGKNQTFVATFRAFEQVCRSAINPNISVQAIEEMLVQHLLTERLFRTVFGNSDFTDRNVIASEIETVIRALTSRSFSRSQYLQQLDHFYNAIEDAARTIDDWSEKQGFLNTVYERFFQGFSRKQADTHGIVYTPQPIVDFMVNSVEEVLRTEFGTSLSTPGVKILDPATGTGNFIVNILRRINRRDLKKKYAEDLFANEVMLLPYYIASLNIEHAYYELTNEYAPFEGICFVDTLDMAESDQLGLFSEENTERVERQKNAAITVIIGNPPYNVGQLNENDNNKNRRYDVVDKRVRETYAKDSRATNKNALGDVYVKFFRWAADRLRDNDGVVCYVSNNSFVDQIAFDGMRKQFAQHFDQIYHLDLHGNVRQNPKLSGTIHNVFGIQVGVGITVAVRNSNSQGRFIKYHRVPEMWRKIEKLAFIADAQNLSGVEWKTLQPDAKQTWITEGLDTDFDTFLPMGTREAKAERGETQTIFKTYSGGVKTNRDEWAYDFSRAALASKAQLFSDTYNSEVDRWQRRSNRAINIDEFVTYDDRRIKWSENLKANLARGNHTAFDVNDIRPTLYRPFCKEFIYFERSIIERVYQMPSFFPVEASEQENAVIWLKVGADWPMFGLMTNVIPDILPQGGTQCFPFYTYSEDGTERRENITDWALAQFRAAYGDVVTKWDIFHYAYALLHHPAYREKYKENLKRELPRLPLVGSGTEHAPATFRAFARVGQQLASLHLGYETAPEYDLQWIVNRAVPFSWRVEKMRLSKDKTQLVVNESLTLASIPPAAFAYRLGNRSALEWVVDQYQVSTDKRSGIVSDPNRIDDEEYIVRLVGRVITVSIETMRLVEVLPPLGG